MTIDDLAISVDDLDEFLIRSVNVCGISNYSLQASHYCPGQILLVNVQRSLCSFVVTWDSPVDSRIGQDYYLVELSVN